MFAGTAAPDVCDVAIAPIDVSSFFHLLLVRRSACVGSLIVGYKARYIALFRLCTPYLPLLLYGAVHGGSVNACVEMNDTM